MWIPKCCDSSSAIDSKLRYTVKLYYQQLKTSTTSGVQSNSYSGSLVLTKRCHIKDRSFLAQDSAINSGVQNAENSKELIFKYFPVTNYAFNEVDWGTSKYKVLSTSKLSSVTIDGTRYTATSSRPFISILVGLKKL